MTLYPSSTLALPQERLRTMSDVSNSSSPPTPARPPMGHPIPTHLQSPQLSNVITHSSPQVSIKGPQPVPLNGSWSGSYSPQPPNSSPVFRPITPTAQSLPPPANWVFKSHNRKQRPPLPTSNYFELT